MLSFLGDARRFLFFTGKGGVGKTSLACATALALADSGRSVLLVSTDPASNLDEMLGQRLSNKPSPISSAPSLAAMNIDPTVAADAYRARVIAQMGEEATDEERATVREELSGACTTEIAAFDEFVGLLADDNIDYDHVVFDTAPTGHTLRLLSLPKAWTGFLEVNERGASCLGPHSGLKEEEERFRAAMVALGDPGRTIFVLVTRPEKSAVAEAARTSSELKALDLTNQCLVVNGVLRPTTTDPIAGSFETLGEQALAGMPPDLKRLPRDEVPLRPFDMVGIQNLRALLTPTVGDESNVLTARPVAVQAELPDLPGLSRMVDELAETGRGLIMVMGKGGAGKTTVAAACAVGLVQRGHQVHLSTTDPAAHLRMTLESDLPGLRVDRIDPKAETERYVEKIMATRGTRLDEQGRALLREDLRSPCTEEVAVFHAFSRIVSEARSAFVILDTAPTGHTLLLMDATGAYHQQVVRDFGKSQFSGRVITPLMRLQDPRFTHVILVTLPETTPVSEAAALQEDLRRAKIEPFAWVINRSLLGSGTQEPLLIQRMALEKLQVERVRRTLARKTFILPWQSAPPVGIAALGKLVSQAS
jgi:arsenite-transporting ATPase